MSDATTSSSTEKGALPKSLTATVNALVSSGLSVPSDAFKLGPTNVEAGYVLQGATSSLVLSGGVSMPSGIDPKAAEMLQTYLQGAFKLGWGAIKGTITAAARGFQPEKLQKAKDVTGNAMKSFGGVVKDFFKGAEAVLDPLLFRFIGARDGRTA
ncbi:MAG: hypothetical protein ACK48E_07410, partial [Holosporales bacterium]